MMKKNPKANSAPAPTNFEDLRSESNLLRLTREFESLTSAIAELEKHSDNERTLRNEAQQIFNVVVTRTNEVLTMNNRTLRVRQVQLENVREQLSQLTQTGSSIHDGCAVQANRKGW